MEGLLKERYANKLCQRIRQNFDSSLGSHNEKEHREMQNYLICAVLLNDVTAFKRVITRELVNCAPCAKIGILHYVIYNCKNTNPFLAHILYDMQANMYLLDCNDHDALDQCILISNYGLAVQVFAAGFIPTADHLTFACVRFTWDIALLILDYSKGTIHTSKHRAVDSVLDRIIVRRNARAEEYVIVKSVRMHWLCHDLTELVGQHIFSTRNKYRRAF